MTHFKHDPHCRYCPNVAVEKAHGHWVCVDHQKHMPWGAAVVAHTKMFENKEVKNGRQDR